MTTIEGDSARAEVSSQQYSTPKVDQTGNIPGEGNYDFVHDA